MPLDFLLNRVGEVVLAGLCGYLVFQGKFDRREEETQAHTAIPKLTI